MDSLIFLVLLSIFVTVLRAEFGTRRTRRGAFDDDVEERIVGGESTTIETFPYQVSIREHGEHLCGGSIIHPSYILTAAHCTRPVEESNLSVNAGSTQVNENGQIRNVTKIYEHPKFNSSSYDNDISILQLDKPLDTKRKNVGVILLPKPFAKIKPNSIGIVTGWGMLSSGGSYATTLQQAAVPLIDLSVCRSFYYNVLTPRMLCAGYATGIKDACQGDSGGPLVFNGVLVGITSFGEGCGHPNSPGVYTKVSQFIKFIKKHVKI